MKRFVFLLLAMATVLLVVGSIRHAMAADFYDVSVYTDGGDYGLSAPLTRSLQYSAWCTDPVHYKMCTTGVGCDAGVTDPPIYGNGWGQLPLFDIPIRSGYTFLSIRSFDAGPATCFLNYVAPRQTK